MIFGRQRRTDPIIEFWTWWPSVRTRLAAGIDAGDGGQPLTDEIGRRVTEIHPKLEWELGAGRVSRHRFMLSPVGNPELRATAARWLALAPPVDDTWEFYDSRQAIDGFGAMRLQIDGHDLGLGDTRFVLSRREHAIDVAVFHPTFADLAEQQRFRIAFLCLDWALGEDPVEIWIGAISATTTADPEPDTVDGLREAVADLAARHDDGPWVILQGRRDGRDVFAVAQAPLRSARWPRFDTHVALVLPFEDRGNGMPTDGALQAMREFEDSLTPALGGDGELLAHESSTGMRTLHYYVDGQTDLAARLVAAAATWRRGRSTTTLDPALKAIGHLDATG